MGRRRNKRNRGDQKGDRDRHRFYLLPGMGKGNKRKHVVFLRWSIVVGIIVSVVLGVILYYVNTV